MRRVRPEDRDFKAPAGYRFSLATPDEIARCEEFHTELDARERREGIARLAMGHHCVIAYPSAAASSPAIFTMWINPRNLNVPGHVKRRLLPHQVFIYKAFTSPEHRGRKIYESGMRFVLAWMSQQGKTELVGYAHVQKTVSRKGLAAVEFDTIGSFRTLGVGPLAMTLESARLRRALPERLASSGMPADRLLTSTGMGR